MNPPYFRGRFVEDDGVDHVQTQDERVVLASNLDIAIEWGLTRRIDDLAERHLWAEKAAFADPAAHTFLADILYRGELVDRFYLVYVDGGRAYIPSPRNTRADQDDVTGHLQDAVWSWPVTLREYRYAKLLNDLSRNQLDDYLNRAGIMVVN